MKVSTCLVTGGAGFIGCAISSALVERYEKVVVLDVLHPQVHAKRERPKGLNAQVELIIGDICDPAVWDAMLLRIKPDVVIHLAAETGTGQSLTEGTRHAQTNVTGTAAMLDALHRARCVPTRFVLSSSRAVYGEGAYGLPSGDVNYPGQRSIQQLQSGQWDFAGVPLPMIAQTLHPAPISIYGATKLAQEHILSSWCTANGSEHIILRFQNVYGAGQSLINSYTGIVSLFCQIARRGESIPLYEDGKMLRDFVLIDDIAASIIKAIEAPSRFNRRIYDIGAGVGTSIGEVAAEIAKIYGAPDTHVCGKYRFGDVRHAWCDTTKAERELGWGPLFTLAQGLHRLIAWIETEIGSAGGK